MTNKNANSPETENKYQRTKSIGPFVTMFEFWSVCSTFLSGVLTIMVILVIITWIGKNNGCSHILGFVAII